MSSGKESWLQTARRAEIVRSAVKVSLVVGTVLLVINQADALLSGSITKGMIAKILLTYFVPYCVSTYAAVQALRNSA
ncbi:MAG: nitrate/nitrite transporter NrtS [Akkermansiaceae bacterium]|jgi:hypothetical protein|tara:strand:+ start:38 stop:271 length:234 start_codon:yes stop_codon:yes gene_type:complete